MFIILIFSFEKYLPSLTPIEFKNLGFLFFTKQYDFIKFFKYKFDLLDLNAFVPVKNFIFADLENKSASILIFSLRSLYFLGKILHFTNFV